MIIRIKLFGVEAFTAEFDDPQPAVVTIADARKPPTVQQVLESKAEGAVRKIIEHPKVGKVIGTISSMWVYAGMQR